MGPSSRPHAREDDVSWRGRGQWSPRVWRGVTVTLLVGGLLTAGAATLAAQEQHDDLVSELEVLAQDAARKLETRLRAVEQTLWTLGAELRVEQADLEQFTAVVDVGELVERTPGVQSLSVAREYPVPGPQRPASGGTSLVVERIVPLELGEGVAGELDLYDRGDERLRATTTARDRGVATATAPLELAYGGTGILYYTPVYVRDADTVAERRASFLGVSIAVVLPPDLFDEILGPTPLVELVVEDLGPVGSAPGSPTPVWRSSGDGLDGGPRADAELQVADRTWRFEVAPTPLLVPSDLAVLTTTLGGVLVTLALAALVGVVLGARDRAEHLVDVRTAELHEAYERLLEANELRSQFVSTISHELRTPLTAVLGFIETVRARGSDPGLDADDLLARAERHARHLDRMIEELLDFGRIERAELHLVAEEADLAELVPSLVADLAPVAGERGVEVVVDAPRGARALVDRDALARMLGNLLENAVRYAPSSAPIEVGVIAQGDVVRVWVSDDGPGIGADDLPFVFERFYRGRDQMGQGTGIGLAVVAALVEEHGGAVRIAAPPGGGTTVTIELPRSTPPPRPSTERPTVADPR